MGATKRRRGGDNVEDGGEERWGEDTDRGLDDGSCPSGASTTGYDEFLMGGADGTSGAAEDIGVWR